MSKVPSRLVFRIPSVALLGVLFLAVCESAVALASPWLRLLYVAPVAIAVWILRTRTVAYADRLLVRRVFSRRVLPWSRIVSLRIHDGKWMRAVLADGSEISLPAVRTRHLSALALITGGRLSDPLATPSAPTADSDSDQGTDEDTNKGIDEEPDKSDRTGR